MPNTLDKESREQIHEIKENAREGIKAAKEDYKLDKQEALEDTGMEAKVAAGATVTTALLFALLPPPINLIGLATLLVAVWGTVSVVNDLDKWNDARVEKNDIVSATRQERKELLAITKNDARIRQKDVSVNAKLAAEALEIDVKGRDAEGRLANQEKKQDLKLRLQNAASRLTGGMYMPGAVHQSLERDINARDVQVRQREQEFAERRAPGAQPLPVARDAQVKRGLGAKGGLPQPGAELREPSVPAPAAARLGDGRKRSSSDGQRALTGSVGLYNPRRRRGVGIGGASTRTVEMVGLDGRHGGGPTRSSPAAAATLEGRAGGAVGAGVGLGVGLGGEPGATGGMLPGGRGFDDSGAAAGAAAAASAGAGGETDPAVRGRARRRGKAAQQAAHTQQGSQPAADAREDAAGDGPAPARLPTVVSTAELDRVLASRQGFFRSCVGIPSGRRARRGDEDRLPTEELSRFVASRNSDGEGGFWTLLKRIGCAGRSAATGVLPRGGNSAAVPAPEAEAGRGSTGDRRPSDVPSDPSDVGVALVAGTYGAGLGEHPAGGGRDGGGTIYGSFEDGSAGAHSPRGRTRSRSVASAASHSGGDAGLRGEGSDLEAGQRAAANPGMGVGGQVMTGLTTV